MEVFPLAFSRNDQSRCEVCMQPPRLKCERCQVTFYCSSKCMELDAQAIHDQVCGKLGSLRRSSVHSLGSQTIRERHLQEQTKERTILAEVCMRVGAAHCNRGHFDLAIPAATLALRLGSEVYGSSNVKIAPSIILLGTASIGLGRLAKAEAYLSQANFLITSLAEEDHALKSKVYRALGKLYKAKDMPDVAIKFFADDIYFSSVASGAESIETVGALFLLAEVFLSSSPQDKGKAKGLLTVVERVWRMQFDQLLSQSFATFDEAQASEALSHISSIIYVQEALKDNAKLCRAYLTLAQYYACVEEFGLARETLKTSSEILKSFENKHLELDLKNFEELLSQLER
eukprot:m.143243 g.143243  ORF g.143243 m.143243 type:complete len:345 (-) comp14894_c0_seq4:1128-2162(-)